MYLYTVYDTVKMEMNQPFMANNDQHAMRIHQQSLKEIPTEFQGEVLLYSLGSIDVETMQIRPHKPVEIPVMTLANKEEGENARS